ncbi:lyase family protein, partial [Streptomyces sp. wa1071]|uniref:lyase family protein n=1 Tax=Streptomyces sp. wa1071 TaxID=1828217 RepID=UPI00211D969A
MTGDRHDVGLLSPVWAGGGVEPLVSDRAYLEAMLEVEVALAETQAGLGIIPAASVGPIRAAARSGRIDPVALAHGSRRAANPVVGLVGALSGAVAELSPEAAEHVHHGCTSQDVLDTATVLVAARALRYTDDALVRTADALALLVARHRDTPMAGRTLTQQAVPVTFGLKAAGWLSLVLDASDRIRAVLATGLPAQLGGAAGTLAAYNEYAVGAPSAGEGGLPGRGTELVLSLIHISDGA